MKRPARIPFRAHWKRRPISIDFDGPLHKFSQGWVRPDIYDGPVEGAHETLRKLLREYAVHILSARDAREVVKWCRAQFPDLKFRLIPASAKDWQVKGVIGVTNVKLPATAYIDDRGIRFTTWLDVAKYFL